MQPQRRQRRDSLPRTSWRDAWRKAHSLGRGTDASRRRHACISPARRCTTHVVCSTKLLNPRSVASGANWPGKPWTPYPRAMYPPLHGATQSRNCGAGATNRARMDTGPTPSEFSTARRAILITMCHNTRSLEQKDTIGAPITRSTTSRTRAPRRILPPC